MKVLFFSPHAFFDVHALPEALVAESLLMQGHDIVSVNCDGIYKKHCLCMPLIDYSDWFSKKKICNSCKINRNFIKKEFGFRSLTIDHYISDEDRLNIAQVAGALLPESYITYHIDGVPLAQYALYEFILNHKLSSTAIPAHLWDEYLAIFENCLSTLFGIRSIIETERPDRIATYNSLYSVNRIVCSVADSLNIPCFTLHSGGHYRDRLQQMTVFKGLGFIINRHPTAKVFRDTPCSEKQLNSIDKHIKELFRATSPWVYTNKSDNLSSVEIRNKLSIKEDQKILLVVMRSNDEHFAAKLSGMKFLDSTPLFKTQFEWLYWLREYSIANPDHYIIFRVHPREFPNKRELVISEFANELLRFLGNFKVPDNLYINLPSDNLSLHDLLKITDVVLNNTSSAGLEAALFGIPVVGVGDKLYSFSLDLQKEPDSIISYKHEIKKAIYEGWSISRVIKAYRWLNYLNSEVAIDISDGYKPLLSSSNPASRFVTRGYRWLMRQILLPSGSIEVKTRSRPLKNTCRLTHAIVNDQLSHIGAFSQTEIGEESREKATIIKSYRAHMQSISSPYDIQFKSRIQACIQNEQIR